MVLFYMRMEVRTNVRVQFGCSRKQRAGALFCVSIVGASKHSDRDTFELPSAGAALNGV